MKRTIPDTAVACFGEALWDVLPNGIFLGGAPLNVAYHLAQHGIDVAPLSAVGRDFLGDELLRRVASWSVRTDSIRRDEERPTGVVRASLDAAGVASYEIVRHVAWDHLAAKSFIPRVSPPRILVYGSLALRGPGNRKSFVELCDAWPSTFRILDLNLRAPHDRGPGVSLALRRANAIKLNDDELSRMTRLPTKGVRQIQRALEKFAASTGVGKLCVTAGSAGAGLFWEGDWFWEPGRPVKVRDTIGAGDAFLAGFIAAHFFKGAPPSASLASACRLGEFVASREGATPAYSPNVTASRT